MKSRRTPLLVALTLALLAAFAVFMLLRPKPPGQVRVSAERVRSDGEAEHWRWTVEGNRRWPSIMLTDSATESVIALGTNRTLVGHALNLSGENRFVCELDAKLTPSGAANGG